MPKLTAEGNVKVWKVPSVADKTAPTLAEIQAGTNLSPFTPTTGVAITWTQNNATLDMIDESFQISAVGTEGAEISLTGVRDDDNDAFFEAFERGENFHLIVSRFGAIESGSVVEVYPSQSHRPVPDAPAVNEFQTSTVSIAVPETPVLTAVVDGGS